jgi:hypothetical protein
VVAIDLAGGEGADGHEVRMPRSCRPVLAARAIAPLAVLAARANAPAARVAGFASFGRSRLVPFQQHMRRAACFSLKIHASETGMRRKLAGGATFVELQGLNSICRRAALARRCF